MLFCEQQYAHATAAHKAAPMVRAGTMRCTDVHRFCSAYNSACSSPAALRESCKCLSHLWRFTFLHFGAHAEPISNIHKQLRPVVASGRHNQSSPQRRHGEMLMGHTPVHCFEPNRIDFKQAANCSRATGRTHNSKGIFNPIGHKLRFHI